MNDAVAQGITEFQCRNCGAYIRTERGFWIETFGAWYHVCTTRPDLPCGPLRPLGVTDQSDGEVG